MILNSPTISGSLTVTGNIITSGSITLSGSVASASYADTASFVALAQSASNAVSAQTASFANEFTVAGNLTAQTLVVQTITSSVDFVTGSTRFGSISANTHVFTGSMSVSGSGTFGSNVNIDGERLTIGGTTNNAIINNIASVRINVDCDNNATGESFMIGHNQTGIDNSNVLFKVRDDGNVGIGTTSPSTLLHLNSTSTQITLQNTSGGTNAERIGMFMNSNDTFKILSLNDNNTTRTDNILVANVLTGFVGVGANPASRLYISTTAGATKAYDDTTKTNIMCFDDTSMVAGVGGSITFGGYKTAQTNGGNFAAIDGVKENGTAGNEAGMFRVWTANSSGIFGERIRIASTGATTFRVSSDSVFDTMILYNTSQTSAGVRLRFQNGYGDLAGIRVLQRDNGALADDGQMEFQVASNASLGTKLSIRNDGLISFPQINDFTTGNSPNTWINPASSYGIYINTSSIRYKRDVTNYDKGLDIVAQLRPVYYKGISEVDGDKQFAGLIAEEIHDLGLTEFVNYLEDGRPNSLSYPNMITLAFKAIQELKAQNDDLQSQINELKAQ
jgi:hypothetical protein